MKQIFDWLMDLVGEEIKRKKEEMGPVRKQKEFGAKIEIMKGKKKEETGR